MEITTENISSWLEAPHSLPDKALVDASLKSWPWFVPLRLMEATYQHRARAFGPKTLALLNLYAPESINAHYLLTQASAEPAAQAEVPVRTEPKSAPTTGVNPEIISPIAMPAVEDAPLIQPIFTEDYFLHQGISPAIEQPQAPAEPAIKEDPKTLMVMMSFAEWLGHFKVKSQREQEEEREKSALRSMWQQEKLAAALDEESEEIPEDVFEMAVTSITREDDIVSEPLARILEKQEKWGAAAEMYRKLGLRNPAKSSYFASRAEAAKKRLQ